MKTTQLDQITLDLCAIPASIKKELGAALLAKGITVLSDTQGMIMMSVIDCFDSPFHLGEVIARQVKISIGTQIGTSVVLGDSFDDALIVASAQIALTNSNTELLLMITNFLQKHAHYRSEKEAVDIGIAETTKVNFGLMVEG